MRRSAFVRSDTRIPDGSASPRIGLRILTTPIELGPLSVLRRNRSDVCAATRREFSEATETSLYYTKDPVVLLSGSLPKESITPIGREKD